MEPGMMVSLIAAILSGVVGLGGVLVAALGLWLTHQERGSPYRELVYTKQIQAYEEIMQDLYRIADSFPSQVELAGLTPEEAGDKIHKAIWGPSQTLIGALAKWRFYTPDSLSREIEVYLKTIGRLMGLEGKNLPYLADPHGDFFNAHYNMRRRLQRAAGVEHLSSATQRLISGWDSTTTD